MKTHLIVFLLTNIITLAVAFMVAEANNTLPEAKFFNGLTGKEISQSDLTTQLSNAQVIFLAEEHGNAAIHRWQLELLMQVNKLPGGVALSMEQFERDKQFTLNDYLQNRITEEELLKNGRVWPNYLESYKPLIEYAKANCIPVIAANLPKDLAKEVGKQGLEFLTNLNPNFSKYVAKKVYAPFEGKYWEDFQLSMTMHGMPMDQEKIRKFYQAQCLKDDTMAESIVLMLNTNAFARIVHTNGKFHSDFKLGTAERVLRLMPEAKVLTISLITIEDPNSAAIEKIVNDNLTRGDILIVIVATEK